MDAKSPKKAASLVVGGSRGIGRACALQLAQDGHDVALVFRHDTESAHAVVDSIQALGKRAWAFQADVASETEVRTLFRRVVQECGGISAVIFSAGITGDGLMATMSLNCWNRVLDTNLTGAFLICRESIKAMRKSGGSIVLVSSTSGLRGQAGQANYSASKGGINAITQSMAKEMAVLGIRINAVAPGFTDTDMLKAMNPRARLQYVQNIPLQRVGQPEEVASVITFLASEKAAYMTGQVVAVDGGLTA